MAILDSSYMIGTEMPTPMITRRKKAVRNTFEVDIVADVKKLSQQLIAYRKQAVIDEVFEKKWIADVSKLAGLQRQMRLDIQTGITSMGDEKFYRLSPIVEQILDHVRRTPSLWKSGQFLVGETVMLGQYLNDYRFSFSNPNPQLIMGIEGECAVVIDTITQEVRNDWYFKHCLDYVSPHLLLRETKVDFSKSFFETAFTGAYSRMTSTRSANLQSTIRDLTTYKSMIATYEKREKEQRAALSQFSKFKTPPEFLEYQVVEAKRHKLVESVGVVLPNRLRIDTHMIFGIDPDTGKKTKFEIGRLAFVFVLDNLSGLKVKAYNKDYFDSLGGHAHPNIGTTHDICYGEHQEEVRALLQSLDIAAYMDFIIDFFSIYPHHGGAPFTSFEGWKDRKTKSARDAKLIPNFSYTL